MKSIFGLVTVIIFIMTAGFSVYGEDKAASTAKGCVLAEVSTGTVLYDENADVKIQQGSLCKLMTVLLVAEEIADGNIKLDQEVTAGNGVSAQNGAVIWLVPGEKITIEQLLKGVIVGNANDAAVVLAEAVAGTEDEFVDMMNARAFELQMRSTVYKACGDTSDEGHYTTAKDTAKLAAELIKHDFLKEYFTTWTDTVRNGQTELVNENILVRNYDGITGLKAGKSQQSGFFLVFTAEKNNIAFISVVLGCEDKDARFDIGRELMGKGFSSYKITTPAFSDEFLKPVSVKNGKQSAVMIKAHALSELVIPKGCDELSTVVLIPDYVNAPVKKGQVIGKVAFYNGDTLLYETNLVSEEKIEKSDFASSIKKVLLNLYK